MELSSNVLPQHSLPGSPSHKLAPALSCFALPTPGLSLLLSASQQLSLLPVTCSSCLTGHLRRKRFHLHFPGASQRLSGRAWEVLGGCEGQGQANHRIGDSAAPPAACVACSLPTGVLCTLRKSLLKGKDTGRGDAVETRAEGQGLSGCRAFHRGGELGGDELSTGAGRAP